LIFAPGIEVTQPTSMAGVIGRLGQLPAFFFVLTPPRRYVLLNCILSRLMTAMSVSGEDQLRNCCNENCTTSSRVPWVR